MSAHAFFIAGTDTAVGKTFATCVLLARARSKGLRAAGMKPVAAGCAATPDGLRNEDALALMTQSGVDADYATVNPIALPDPLSPHLAAARAGVVVDTGMILAAFDRLAARADLVLVEGAGGWLAPLSDTLAMNDLARRLGLPVILVVGLRLGCLNHAQLTARAIAADGLRLAGWIGSTIDLAMACLAENVDTLRRRLPAPCLGVLPWAPAADPADLAGRLRLPAALA
ncbi:MAG: dethiobiotin synthase [Pseudomonadota bacterium]|jgi:dethiobiotin synthetase